MLTCMDGGSDARSLLVHPLHEPVNTRRSAAGAMIQRPARSACRQSLLGKIVGGRRLMRTGQMRADRQQPPATDQTLNPIIGRT